MKAVNLLPRSDHREGRFGGRKPLVAAGVVALVALMGLWGFTARQGASSATDDLAAAQATSQELELQLGAYREAELRLARQRLRRGAVIALAAGRVNWERIVRDLATVLPPQVWLTRLSAEAPVAQAATAAPLTGTEVIPKGVHLEGYAFRQKQVASLLVRVETIPGLGEPRLASAEQERLGGRTVVRFVVDIPVDQRAQDRLTLVPTGAAVTP